MLKLSVKIVTGYWFLISALLLSIITVLSLTPLPELPKVPGGDKLHHFIAYSSLAIPVALRGHPRLLMFLLFYIAWGGGIELIQPYANRYGEWADFIVNSVGVIVGAGLGLTLKMLLKRKS